MSEYIEKAFSGAKPYAGAIIAGISYISMKNAAGSLWAVFLLN